MSQAQYMVALDFEQQGFLWITCGFPVFKRAMKKVLEKQLFRSVEVESLECN